MTLTGPRSVTVGFAHGAAVAHHVGGENGGESALDSHSGSPAWSRPSTMSCGPLDTLVKALRTLQSSLSRGDVPGRRVSSP